MVLATNPVKYDGGKSTPAAIGGKLAAPDRPVISLLGDGCFLTNEMEVTTAVNYDILVV
jgi:acetolactate synthase-1/2/3 large subunit